MTIRGSFGRYYSRALAERIRSGGANQLGLAVAPGAAAAEVEVVVEEEVAGSFSGLDGEGREGVIFGVELQDAAEINGADDVDVVEEERLVHLAGIAAFPI